MSGPGGSGLGCLVWGVWSWGSGLGGSGMAGGSGAGGAWSRGICLPGGGWVSQHALRQTPLPPCGQTHACKNITLAQLRYGR